MASILVADDLAPEMFVTVHSVRQQGTRVQRHGPHEFEVHEVVAPVSPGLPLQVLGISLPFVVCSVLNPGGGHSGPVIIDLRTVCLARVAPQFIDAIVAFDAPDTESGPDEKPHREQPDRVPQSS